MNLSWEIFDVESSGRIPVYHAEARASFVQASAAARESWKEQMENVSASIFTSLRGTP
jgi:hypothetical protein